MVVGLVTMVVATDVNAGVHHPDCPGLVSDIAPGAPTPIGGTVWVKAGDEHYNVGYHDAGYVAGPQGGHAVSHVDVCPPVGTTTTSSTTTPPTTTTSSVPATTTTVAATTTTVPGTSTSTTSPTSSTTTASSTTLPNPGLFAFSAVGTECVDGVPMILITFPPRPELNGQVGELVIRDSFGDVVLTTDLTFIASATVELFYPDTTDDVSLTYTLGDETANAEATYPNEGECAFTPTTTTTSIGTTTSTPGPGSTTTTSTTAPSTSSSTPTVAPTTTAATSSTSPSTPPGQLPPTL